MNSSTGSTTDKPGPLLGTKTVKYSADQKIHYPVFHGYRDYPPLSDGSRLDWVAITLTPEQQKHDPQLVQYTLHNVLVTTMTIKDNSHIESTGRFDVAMTSYPGAEGFDMEDGQPSQSLMMFQQGGEHPLNGRSLVFGRQKRSLAVMGDDNTPGGEILPPTAVPTDKTKQGSETDLAYSERLVPTGSHHLPKPGMDPSISLTRDKPVRFDGWISVHTVGTFNKVPADKTGAFDWECTDTRLSLDKHNPADKTISSLLGTKTVKYSADKKIYYPVFHGYRDYPPLSDGSRLDRIAITLTPEQQKHDPQLGQLTMQNVPVLTMTIKDNNYIASTDRFDVAMTAYPGTEGFDLEDGQPSQSSMTFRQGGGHPLNGQTLLFGRQKRSLVVMENDNTPCDDILFLTAVPIDKTNPGSAMDLVYFERPLPTDDQSL